MSDCICYQGIWKGHVKISTWIICCEGLTDGVAFVAQHKKSKITLIIMNAFQFSIKCTIIDMFWGIRSKALIEYAQYSCK